MTPLPNSCILWFLKAPLRGEVKSRLAVSIGKEHALQLYRCFLKDLKERIRMCGLPVKIYYTPRDGDKVLFTLLGEDFNYIPQEGKDLGERLAHAFEETFREGFERIIVVGGDSPDLSGAAFRKAFERLSEADVVIGPAHDGGYYLLGASREGYIPSLFQEINWGEETVCAETIQRCNESGKTPTLLPYHFDIDTLDDLKAFYQRNGDTEFASSNTMRYVRKHLFPLVSQQV